MQYKSANGGLWRHIHGFGFVFTYMREREEREKERKRERDYARRGKRWISGRGCECVSFDHSSSLSLVPFHYLLLSTSTLFSNLIIHCTKYSISIFLKSTISYFQISIINFQFNQVSSTFFEI